MRLLALVLLALVGGCLAPAATIETAAAPLTVDGVAAESVRWDGSRLRAAGDLAQIVADAACWTKLPVCDEPPVACEDANCERRGFTLAEGAGALVLTVRWPTSPTAMDAWIEDASGAIVALAPHRYLSPFGLAARVEDPAPGEYEAVVAVRYGEAPYQAALRVEPAAIESEPRALLPNLVTLPPTDLTLETPDYVGASYFTVPAPGVREAMEAAGRKGCRVDESAEYGAVRCLRFSNAVGNLGEGPLDVLLPAGSMAFRQQVHWSDGSVETRPGGGAEWHATHAHWHNAANNRFTVHPYDPETKARGEPLNDGRKGGICFADIGVVDVGLPNTWPAAETGWNCFAPRDETRDFRMGITPGWYDLYPLLLSDQYVDITGAKDGTYVLCSVTNGEGTLLEADLTDNEGCTPFRLAGDDIELLEPAPYHAMTDA